MTVTITRKLILERVTRDELLQSYQADKLSAWWDEDEKEKVLLKHSYHWVADKRKNKKFWLVIDDKETIEEKRNDYK